MIQTSKRFFDNGKPDDALKLASDAKRVCADWSNEFEEVVAQLARLGTNLRYVDESRAAIGKLREDLDLFKNALREEVIKAR